MFWKDFSPIDMCKRSCLQSKICFIGLPPSHEFISLVATPSVLQVYYDELNFIFLVVIIIAYIFSKVVCIASGVLHVIFFLYLHLVIIVCKLILLKNCKFVNLYLRKRRNLSYLIFILKLYISNYKRCGSYLCN